ncbi:MAG: sensor domain-containing diguanylate cyclase [Accumulibacter sp.]|jgi:diguanylate cyclase (GGDEF)-like protein/PAS domain S-box-containing protein|uniref:sensor domain-containing diguanylate cyclase n=1 Tax=Accumulibacter sp. TaxID=2053492 RepID=UPI0033159BFC
MISSFSSACPTAASASCTQVVPMAYVLNNALPVVTTIGGKRRRRPLPAALSLLESVTTEDALLLLDATGIIRYCSKPFLFGGEAGQLQGRLLASLIPTLLLRRTTPGYNIAYARFWALQMPWQRHTLVTLDQRHQDVDIGLRAVVLNGRHSLLVTIRPVPASDAGSRHLQRLLDGAESATEIYLVTDLSGTITYVNPAFEKVTGYRSRDVLGQPARMLSSGAHGPEVFSEMWATLRAGRPFHAVLVNRRCDGTHYHHEMSIRPFVEDGKVTHFVSTGQDVSEHRRALQQLTDRAHHDCLTGLPNRHLFLDRLQQALARANRRASPCCLLLLDLDAFKAVNDQHGHAAGDRLLQAMASGLRQCVRSNDTVARLGGDEFGLILEGMDSVASTERILRQIADAVCDVVATHALGVRVTASIGACILPQQCDDQAWWLAQADMAMYHTKRNGGNGYSFASHSAPNEALDWQRLEPV